MDDPVSQATLKCDRLLAQMYGTFIMRLMYFEITEGRVFSETLPYAAAGIMDHGRKEEVLKYFQDRVASF